MPDSSLTAHRLDLPGARLYYERRGTGPAAGAAGLADGQHRHRMLGRKDYGGGGLAVTGYRPMTLADL
ncbi:MAG TPA: hypothetical protein VIX86_06570, partial [Streptosporangiaceae bacterium]